MVPSCFPARLVGMCLVIIAMVTCLTFVGRADSPEFENVAVSKTVFNPSAGERTSITFRLTRDTRVTATVHDADHYPVATLADGRPCYRGVTVLEWDGRDGNGTVVPDEAYTVRLEAVGELGAGAVHDPAMSTGGEPIKFFAAAIDREAGEVRFNLSVPARVQLRGGIHDGPLLVTLLDWVPYAAGDHRVAWDGYDQSKVRPVWADPDFLLMAKAYRLPEGCIITTGNSISYMEYWTRAAAAEKMAAARFRLATEAGYRARAYGKAARSRALADGRAKLGDPYLSGKFMNQSPQFGLEIGRLASKGSGGDGIEVRTVVAPMSKQLLDEQRYEYVMYVDGVLEGEQETGYSPYTWMLDTSGLSAGKHLVTVNVATLNGQVGTASAWIEVPK